VADGEHRPDGAIEVIGDLGGLVDDEQRDALKRADDLFDAGQADDAAAVFELVLRLGFLGELDGPGDRAVALADVTEQLAGLPLGAMGISTSELGVKRAVCRARRWWPATCRRRGCSSGAPCGDG
jgi:hypothetical protein